jgi:hypothetical protein
MQLRLRGGSLDLRRIALERASARVSMPSAHDSMNETSEDFHDDYFEEDEIPANISWCGSRLQFELDVDCKSEESRIRTQTELLASSWKAGEIVGEGTLVGPFSSSDASDSHELIVNQSGTNELGCTVDEHPNPASALKFDFLRLQQLSINSDPCTATITEQHHSKFNVNFTNEKNATSAPIDLHSSPLPAAALRPAAPLVAEGPAPPRRLPKPVVAHQSHRTSDNGNDLRERFKTGQIDMMAVERAAALDHEAAASAAMLAAGNSASEEEGSGGKQDEEEGAMMGRWRLLRGRRAPGLAFGRLALSITRSSTCSI